MRLIDADALLKRIDNISAHFAKTDQQKALVGRAMYCVDKAPTIHVAAAEKGESNKPRICEALGVEVGEVWQIGFWGTNVRINQDGKLEIENRHKLWDSADLSFSQHIVDAINDPKLVIHKKR